MKRLIYNEEQSHNWNKMKMFKQKAIEPGDIDTFKDFQIFKDSEVDLIVLHVQYHWNM